MSRAFSRSDRVAQMTKQEELIAKKRQEIKARQKTSELGKAVAAAQINLGGKMINEEIEDLIIPVAPSPCSNKSAELLIAAAHPTPQNNFCNDGSFFEHFKKIIESNKVEDVVNEEVLIETPTVTECSSVKELDCKDESQTFPTSESGNNSDTNSNSIISTRSIIPNAFYSSNSEGIHNYFNPDDLHATSFLEQQQQTHFNPNVPPPTMKTLLTPPPPLQSDFAEPFATLLTKSPSLTEVRTAFQSHLPPPPPPPSELKSRLLAEQCNLFQKQEDHNSVEPKSILPTSVESLVKLVVDKGDGYEEYIQSRKNDAHSSLWFLFDVDSEEYSIYRQSVLRVREQTRRRNAIYKTESNDDKYDPESVCDRDDNDSDDEYNRTILNRNTNNLKRRIETRVEFEEEERQAEEARQKKRKSRWGEKIEETPDSPVAQKSIFVNAPTTFANQHKPLLSAFQRTDPALLQYARLNYGTSNLSEEDWNKCEEHFKVNLLYQDMMKKREEIDQLAKSGKFKYEYDSDEDVSGGTWEHKLRNAEMEATEAWADALTAQSEGKHHIGDFLPPEELKKFMEQYEAKKNNRMPDLSDYKEYKLKEDNKGFQMLQRLGWQEGQGLGADGEGIIDPVNKALQRQGNQGLGVNSPVSPGNCDNEYEAYRKRMMLAYRFRPNPLNNPRRMYY